jgi:hypothetical protein
VDHQAERGNVDPARRHVGGHADARAAVAQGLDRLVALVLAVLARKRHGGKAALEQRGVQPADVVARRAEQHGRFRLVEAQQVDHRVLDVVGRDGDRLIADVAMALALVDRRDAQRIALILLGQRRDRARHGGGKQQGAALGRSGVEQFFQVFAEAHVEHFVGFVEHHEAQARQVERAAFEMVAQAAGRAHHDMRAVVELATFLRRVHPADAGGDAQPGFS